MSANDPKRTVAVIMKASKILIVITLVCGVLSGYGVAVSTGPESLGWHLRAVFGSIGAIAIMALFAIWFMSSDNQK